MESDQCSEQEAILFHSIPSYPCTYYVQSPSTVSHANSATYQSPLRSMSDHNATHVPHHLTLISGYSSSRGSNNSFPNDKKIMVYDDVRRKENRLIIVKGGDGCDDREEEDDEGYWGRYLSFRRSSSCLWICLQICWRLMVSFGVALMVFYIATKPPPPHISIKVGGVRQFGLGEGVDSSGVTTKILSCNCSMDLVIDNNSKLFGLHVSPPLLEMSFGRLPLAISHGPKLYAESHESTLFRLTVATEKKPMYGAGRSMQDMLDSGKGLPVLLRLSLTSKFQVVWNLINPTFHHQAQCLLLLHTAYDKKHRTQTYTSTCTLTS